MQRIWKIGLVILILSIMTLGWLIMGGTIVNGDESKSEPGFRGVAFAPAAAKVMELDPFYGIGIYFRKLKNDAVINIGFDLLSGSGVLKTEVYYSDGTTESTEAEIDDTLFIGSYNHGFLLENSKGKGFKEGLTYLVLGGGLVYESLDIETEFLEEEGVGFGFLINGGIGYSNENVDLLALYSLFPGSGNVTGALYLSVGIKF